MTVLKRNQVTKISIERAKEAWALVNTTYGLTIDIKNPSLGMGILSFDNGEVITTFKEDPIPWDNDWKPTSMVIVQTATDKQTSGQTVACLEYWHVTIHE